MTVAVKSIEALLDEALDKIDEPGATISSHVRRTMRIASKRNDFVAMIRLYFEMIDHASGSSPHEGLRDAQANLTALLGEEEAKRLTQSALAQYLQVRRQGKDGAIYGQGIGQLEARPQALKELLQGYKQAPQNLSPHDTFSALRQYDAATAQLLPIHQALEDIIERVKQAVHDILIETDRQLASGQRRPDVFERGKSYITNSLRMRAPDALVKFQAAEASLADGTPEDLAHALTSCRRMIKSLADALYPATGAIVEGQDGRPREMSDAAYRNRLLQFASEQLGNTHLDLVSETLRSLGTRLQRLTELSSKGVHDEVTRTEAESCVMWTYLTAADFLRIADGTASGDTPQQGGRAARDSLGGS